MEAIEPARPAWRSVAFAAGLAGAICAALYLSVGDVNLNLADEGYLWYGVLRFLEGEVPFRDFQSYDPGRYRWCAVGSAFFGSGILGVRASVAAFQALGLWCGLLVARRLVTRDAWLIPIALVLALWMYPRHKLFEPAITMIVTWFIVRLVESPTTRRHFAAGLCTGLVAWFGRNHGVYSAAASALAVGLLAWRTPRPGLLRRIGAWAGGVVLGYLPVLAALVFVPGFAGAFWRAVLDLLSKGANIPHPWPWPWTTSWSNLAGLDVVSAAAVSVAFLLPLLVPIVGVVTVLRLAPTDVGRRATLVGTVLVGSIYVHHVSVRSDLPHLAQCIQPLLLAAIALGTGRRRAAVVAGLCVLTFFATFHRHTPLRLFAPWREAPQLIEYEVAGETLRLMPPQAQYLERVRLGVGERLAEDDEIFIAPSRPTLYPFLGKRSPVPQIYLFWFAPEEEQREIVRALDEREVRWVLIVDSAVDRREDLRFQSTHPIVWDHLARAFDRVSTPGMRSDHLLFERRDE